METSKNLVEFLSQLRKLDIHLTAEDGRLGCNAPKGALTPELKATLSARKVEILELLSRNHKLEQTRPIERLQAGGPTVPSLAQQRLWFLEQMDPGGTAYTISSGTLLHGQLDSDALEKALKEIIRRHEVLRTSLRDVNGAPVAEVHPAGDWSMEIVSMSHVPEAQRIAELRRIADERAARPFDLSQPPLLRACLVVFDHETHGSLLEVHHICCDGWSMGALTKEMEQLYLAFSAGERSPLPELPIQYSDYARWHRDYIENGGLRSQIAYWKRKLGGTLPTIDLPTDRPRPPVMTYRGKRAHQKRPLEVLESVRRFSMAENVTPFMTLLAAFKILLFRYSGQSDVIVGSVTAGRSRPELEKLAGLFLNNLALRTDLSGDPTVRELLQRVRETSLGAFANEDVPFDHLAEVLPVSRDLRRSPLFQTMFILQNFPFTDLMLPGLTTSRWEAEGTTARYDLTIEAIEFDGNFELHWEYNTDLFDTATIERMQQHFNCLLDSLLFHPEARISELQLLTGEETQHFIETADSTTHAYPDVCLHQWFEEQAARTPRALAVSCGASELTYAELDIRSNRLAHRLRELGTGPDQLVGICLERSVEMAVALLAVLKAGGAYVPIDPQYPTDRIAFMMEDSGAPILITTEHLLGHLPGNFPHIICLDRDRETIGRLSSGPVESRVARHHLAYVIYTSGSTGKPKGVEITHQCIVNFLASMQAEPGITSRDRLLAVTTLSFDIAGLEFYLPLVSGAQVIIAPRSAVADGVELARLLDETGATIMQATPITWRLLLEAGWRGTSGLKILCGGEAMPRDLANSLLTCGEELWNLYGPTETTVWSTVYRVDSRRGSVPIGKPIANTPIYVLDQHQKIVPTGVIGELFIGGDGVARGYRGRPELTGERFITDPFHKGARLYRTGDLVRWLPDGNLDCLGRADNQVKVRGYRIELAEIETALAQQPGVQQAVVIVREDTPGDQRLTAYVIAQDDVASNDAADIWREGLRARLPEYMIPSAFVRLDTFPLTPNRKVDRKLLPAPDGAARDSAAYAPPRTDAEKEVAAIWQDLLRNQRVGINDNFFDLGGHSLLVVQLQSRLKQQFHCEVSLVDLFQRPTVSSMASFLNEMSLQTAGSN